jgi:hypothetical protein
MHLDHPEIEPGVVAKEKVVGPDGEHQVKVTKGGKVVKCSECIELRAKYGDELAKHPEFESRLKEIEAMTDPAGKARAASDLDQKLSVLKTKQQNDVKSELDLPSKAPYVVQPKEAVDPTKIAVYRGGAKMKVRPRDWEYDENGLIKPTRGLSLNTDPDDYWVVKLGGAYRVFNVPSELQIIQTGEAGTHVELVPKQAVSAERLSELLDQIELQKHGR